ncbi:MAG: anaerobic ribonucleoside-triphosphate reductase activating protein [Synergistaceae bacterium]
MEKITIGGYLSSSFLDWDGHLSAVIFTTGCNFKCPYCHNSTLVNGESSQLDLDEVLQDIKRRATFLDGVVISGGEPCMWKHLTSTMEKIKEMGLEIKLDTNGSFNEKLEEILDKGLVDHIAMDIKAPFEDKKIKEITKSEVKAETIIKSVKMIKEKAKSYEFRTTYSPYYLNEKDLIRIRENISDDEHWVIQCFKPNNCLDQTLLEVKATTPEEIKKILPLIKVRG